MTGHVAKKGNKYYLVLETRDPSTGKRKQKWISTGLTRKRDAEERLHEVLADYQRGAFVDPTNITVAELLNRWIEDVVKLGSESRYKRYESIVRCHLIPNIGAVPLRQLSPADVQAMYRKLYQSGKIVQGKKGEPEPPRAPMAEATIRKIHNVLNAAVDMAVKWRLISANPLRGAVVVPSAGDEDDDAEGEVRYWTPEETRRFLAVAAGSPNYVLYALALGTGLRRGELFGLKWDDVDFERATISVRRTLKRASSPPKFGPPKTKTSRRTISISPSLVTLLRRHRARQLQEKMQNRNVYEDYGLIFAQPNGRPMHPNNLVKREFARLKKLAGVTDIRFHDLRHTHAVEMIRRGIHVKAISARLGHASIVVTMDTYGHLLPEVESEAAMVIEDLLPHAGSENR